MFKVLHISQVSRGDNEFERGGRGARDQNFRGCTKLIYGDPAFRLGQIFQDALRMNNPGDSG